MSIELTGTKVKVHAQEKIQTDDYESYTANATIEADVDHMGDLTNGTRRELRARLLALEKDVQEAAERACENRIAAETHEDWNVDGGDGDAE